MADRYFWGTSKMEKVRARKYIDLDLQDAEPDAEKGRLYVDSDGKLKICNDDTSFETVGSQSS